MKNLKCLSYLVLLVIISGNISAAAGRPAITGEELVEIEQHYSSIMVPFTAKYQAGETINSDEALAVLRTNPRLNRQGAADGHHTYRHIDFPEIRFGIIARVVHDLSPPELKDFYINIQTYMNFLNNNIFERIAPGVPTHTNTLLERVTAYNRFIVNPARATTYAAERALVEATIAAP
jgi:hypothetical protein